MVFFYSLSDVLNGLTFIHEITIQSLHEVEFNLSVVGTKVTDDVLVEPFRSFARQAIQTYASHELKAQRPAIAEQIQVNLAAYLDGSPFEIINLSIVNIDYPDVVAQAVETILPTTALDSSAAAGLGRHLLLA